MLSWVFGAMFITFVVLAIVFTTEKNFANRFPVEQVTNTLSEIYEAETGQPIKYIGGFIELSIPLSLYNNGKYIAVLNTYDFPNPWIDVKDLQKTGAIIIGRHKDRMNGYVEATAPGLAHLPEIKPFSFIVKSVVGREREYNMYYAVIKPNAEYND